MEGPKASKLLTDPMRLLWFKLRLLFTGALLVLRMSCRLGAAASGLR